MNQTPQHSGDELIRLADLEWLDLSDLVRLDDDWRRTLVFISRLHLVVTAVLALLVIAFTLLGRPGPMGGEIAAIAGIAVCVAGMAYFVFAARDVESLQLRNLRFVVFLSILAVSLMVFLLRDLQGDYYLLYFLPLISAAGYLGFTGGLLAGIASAAAYTIVFLFSPVSFAPGSLSALVLRTLLFILVASLLGLIAERHLTLLTALRASHMQALELAVKDTRSGLYNRSLLESRLGGELARAERTNTPVAFLVVDVYGMRHINQDHGYAAGDAVLRTIGTIIQKQLRLSDVPARWGVDEFAVLLYGSDAQGAVAVARRIAVDLAQESFQDPTTGQSFKVTVSQGIAAYPVHTQDKSGAELVDRAYEAMRNTHPGQPVAVWSG